MTLAELEKQIKGLRTTMLVNSYLYYVLDRPVYSDATYDGWAMALRVRQETHPTNKIGFYDDAFADWGVDGFTGMHLPRDEWVKAQAEALLELYS